MKKKREQRAKCTITERKEFSPASNSSYSIFDGALNDALNRNAGVVEIEPLGEEDAKVMEESVEKEA